MIIGKKVRMKSYENQRVGEIDETISKFNLMNIKIEKIEEKLEKAKKKRVLGLSFFLQSLVYSSRIFALELILVSLPNSPRIQILMMSIIELIYLLGTTYCSIKFFKIQPKISMVSKPIQSLTLLLIYFHFALILINSEVGNNFRLQRNIIYLVIFGVSMEYVFILMNLFAILHAGFSRKRNNRMLEINKEFSN